MSHRKNPIPTPVRGLPLPVGDAAVIAVAGEEGQLGTGRGLHPPDDEPHRRGDGLTLEGGVGGLGHRGGGVHPVGNRRPGIFGYGLAEIAQALLDFTQNLKEATDAITLGLRHLRLASEGFSLSAANADVQELPATPCH